MKKPTPERQKRSNLSLQLAGDIFRQNRRGSGKLAGIIDLVSKPVTKSIDSFLAQCRSSSNEAYQQFKQLLEQLDNPTTRQAARQFLSQLHHQVKQPSAGDHFQFLQQPILAGADQKQTLTLLQFPSTFEPEAWSFTFYEGLIRYPAVEYQDLKLIELGCGIGWISIAIALRYLPEKIYGLDINPKAVTCARLNLYLNGLDDDGELIPLAGGKNLLQLVEFEQSDLCNHFDGKVDYFDRIIGCIPQVLNPEPEIMDNLVAESASDEYLQSLSNYTAQQGYIEDQFGLGLIARAVEQAIPLIKSNGKLILNLGGRPGRSVLERLMQRHGFRVRRIWQTLAEQAADTDIEALVAIEKSTGHRFEFYMSAEATTPIDARAALAYLQRGGLIYHSVDVYEAKMTAPQQIKAIYREIHRIGSDRLKGAVDLTYDRYEDAEERYSFLAFLAQWLKDLAAFPYEDTRGLLYFRQQVVEYLRYYHQVKYDETQVLITPGRMELLSSLLTAYSPELTLIDKGLRHLIKGELDTAESEVIELPSSIEYTIELIEKLKPQVVITRLNAQEIHSAQLVKSLVDCALNANVILVIDLSDHIDLSSDPKSHGVYHYLQRHGKPDNLILMSALINNRVYEQYSLTITLLTNQAILSSLVDTAELSYCRTPILTQLYYAHLLEELLYFQRTRSYSADGVHSSAKTTMSGALALSRTAEQAFGLPAIVGSHLPFNAESVRLDYGENEMPAPSFLKDMIFESYLLRHFNEGEASPDKPIRQLLENRLGLPQSLYAKMVFSSGVTPLFHGLLKLCRDASQTLIIPTGSYGSFTAAMTYQGLTVKTLPTDEKNDFKMTPQGLKAILAVNPGSWVFLNAPVVNPTGALYSQQELAGLLTIAVDHQATVVFDSVFAGLEFDADYRLQLSEQIEAFAKSGHAKFVLVSSLSKEYAAGGLRFGYAWSTSSSLIAQLAKEVPRTPHFTLGYATRELFEAHNQGESQLMAHLAEQRKTLAERAQRLGDLLIRQGWLVMPAKAGLFLVAKPQKYIEAHQLSAQEGADRVAQLLFEQTNVSVNNSTWTGLPGYCRFVLSVKADDFAEALRRIEGFKW